jgi:hypothetical protein
MIKIAMFRGEGNEYFNIILHHNLKIQNYLLQVVTVFTNKRGKIKADNENKLINFTITLLYVK